MASQEFSGFIRVKGASEHNLKAVNLSIPRDALVVFTGISGSGKSSLAFGTLYAEAQRRYLDSVSPYARRLFNQMPVPKVEQIEGLPPAVALQQQRGAVSTRSSVGSVTTISNLLRMLYSRAGDYPDGQSIIYAEGFSPNTPEGACPHCHGLGRVYEVTERSMVPDDTLTIRERAVAAWPAAWQGQNQRDILTTLGYDIDVPWKDLPQKTRDWILFTEEQPVVPVYANRSREEVKQAISRKLTPDYMGTFTSVQRYVMQTFATTQSPLMKKRVAQYMLSSECKVCGGKRLKKESLAIKFSGLDIAEMARLSLEGMADLFSSFLQRKRKSSLKDTSPEKILVADRIVEDVLNRLQVILDLGLGYLTLERSTPTLSPGELQRLRLAAQVYSNLFGVVYVLDEPSAGLHPADTEALLRILDRLKAAGNSLFVVEHEPEVIQHADWIVDVGPAAGELGGQVLYSGPLGGLEKVESSVTKKYIFEDFSFPNHKRQPTDWLKLEGITRNNLHQLSVDIPLGVFTCVTGVSGSGKSSLVSQVLVELVSNALGTSMPVAPEVEDENPLEKITIETLGGTITEGIESIKRLIVVDQKPIGRTPRSNLATYTGVFDNIRKLFAATPTAKARKYDAGRFSFNVAKGRCPHCEGEGSVMVELLFLPSVYSPCPTCQGKRYNPETLEVKYNHKHIAQVLALSVDEAYAFFKNDKAVAQTLGVIRDVGLGYLRLGQPATELSGGEAQRIKLATELQRQQQGNTLYILDEPTTGLHPADVEKLMVQLQKLVEAGNTVIVIEHDMSVAAASDYVIDMGPGAGNQGGKVVAQGPPGSISKNTESRTAPYLLPYIQE
ncbi:excinuclease ABC subunit UvrA [Siphonobacter sp. SORGH_AS_0500]|uniref:excinuclease ABC subunit UvrA n=1 Tax=Siphonobacter sp. SORGH_AS_0500 TaxID=1864824 RepID=UPI00285B51B1|nr:excinuclease ABC subunit UvrA [Siphonobacter sp. SORGH_AS_0500]MDR6197156.1 excinuclease ABC subunit A [Siphonobacter sp. SORGH_AS_0500]